MPVLVCGLLVSEPSDVFSQLINCLPSASPAPKPATPAACPAGAGSGGICAAGGGFFSPTPTPRPPRYAPPSDPAFNDCVDFADFTKLLQYMLNRDKDAEKPGGTGDLARRGYGNWRANSREAAKITSAFVGPGARTSGSGKATVGPIVGGKQRIVRGPSVKARDGKQQVNLEIWTYDKSGNKTLTTNAHIDIDDGGCP
jgi:hypothetical protein